MNENIDTRNYDELSSAIALAQHTVYKDYLSELSTYSVVQPPQILLDQSTKDYVRLFKLDELSCKKGEDMFQKLSTVYHASMSLGCNLIVMIDAKSTTAPVDIYLGVRRTDADDKSQLNVSFRALMGGLASNFPGTRRHPIESQTTAPGLIKEIFGENAKHISSVSCVAALRDKSKTENKTFVQGLERFIDAMRGNTYTALFIAEPILPEEQAIIRSGYEELYSALSPFRKSVWSYSENKSTAIMESLTRGTARSVTNGTAHTQGHTINVGMNIGMSGGTTTSRSEGHTDTTPTKVARVGNALAAFANIATPALTFFGGPIGGAVGAVIGAVGGALQGSSSATTITDTIGKSLNAFGGLNAGYARNVSDSENHAETITENESKTTGQTDTTGTGKTLQIENTNKSIEEMLKRIEEQLKRIQQGEDYGSYSCGAYFLSAKLESSILAANTYRALMLGEGSSIESGAINSWNGVNDPERVSAIKEYLQRFVHPIFAMPVAETSDDEYQVMTYTPGTTVSGLELPLHLGLPTKSVYGLPVLEYAEFGRNVKIRHHKEREAEVSLGKIYHMGQTESASVSLNINELTAHTFITGSTGSGKSNTIYTILNELTSSGKARFLVIEPAKGEYKDVFGGRDDVTVLGTNPRIMKLLRLNPFSFPGNIHVLEHIDRLVEIFNACWPMYAAMPAVLKDAVETTYRNAGWDMTQSVNGRGYFPTFLDLLEELPKTIQKSNYSADTQSDYTGALVTRIKSLTNGIIGQIFCSKEEIPSEQLFDQNVIVDLSRIGSAETKSLLMGLLTMKLQEYRMSKGGMNRSLQHITVLEEAHNLLRRTSSEQSQESSNLQGKSVEMIANAIAEMRTYGEGFIIADQSPGLMDMSVIRNTNTKIIMRLPDETDRQLVGKAAALNETQIEELARLPKGVAAVYQNEWIEPVLCSVIHFKSSLPLRNVAANGGEDRSAQVFFSNLLRPTSSSELSQEVVDAVYRWIDRLNIDLNTKTIMRRSMRDEVPEKAKVLFDMFDGKQLILKVGQAESASPSVINDISYQIRDLYQIQDMSLVEEIRKMIFAVAVESADRTELKAKIQELEEARGDIS